MYTNKNPSVGIDEFNPIQKKRDINSQRGLADQLRRKADQIEYNNPTKSADLRKTADNMDNNAQIEEDILNGKPSFNKTPMPDATKVVAVMGGFILLYKFLNK